MMEHMAFKGTSIVGTNDYAGEKPLLDAEDALYARIIAEKQKGAKTDAKVLEQLEADFKKAQEAAREKVKSNEFTALLEQNGATGLNASTANDITNYYYSLPSNRLELWSLLEGGRMAHPVFREFYKERDVVYEERRMRYESSPTGRLFWEFITTAFVAHPYGFGGIGYPSDLKSFTRKQGEVFYRDHYVAKNMCVALVGDVKIDEERRYADNYWNEVSDAPVPAPVATVEPEQRAERRITLEDPAQPFIFIGWHIPAASDPSYPAYEAVASLLGGGNYSRLYKTIVKEKKIATTASTFTGFPGEKYPTMIVAVIVPAAGQDPVAVEAEVHKVIEEAMTTKPFTKDELDGFKVRTRAQLVGAAERNAGLAGALARAEMIQGDWREFFRSAERVATLTPGDLQSAMKKSVLKSNRTVAMIVNAKTAANEGGR
jgi:predicted Zn-dependent peptidase